MDLCIYRVFMYLYMYRVFYVFVYSIYDFIFLLGKVMWPLKRTVTGANSFITPCWIRDNHQTRLAEVA